MKSKTYECVLEQNRFLRRKLLQIINIAHFAVQYSDALDTADLRKDTVRHGLQIKKGPRKKGPRACKSCLGHGLWAVGYSWPMGSIDAADGCPTKACPSCGAGGKK